MGYFSNGTEGMGYKEIYCSNCIHQNGFDGKSGCAIWLAHMLHNYKECNNKDSILHLLIPRNKEGTNEQCTMFVEGVAPGVAKEHEPPIDVSHVMPAMREWAEKHLAPTENAKKAMGA